MVSRFILFRDLAGSLKNARQNPNLRSNSGPLQCIRVGGGGRWPSVVDVFCLCLSLCLSLPEQVRGRKNEMSTWPLGPHARGKKCRGQFSKTHVRKIAAIGRGGRIANYIDGPNLPRPMTRKCAGAKLTRWAFLFCGRNCPV